jgi:hypothetical protein
MHLPEHGRNCLPVTGPRIASPLQPLAQPIASEMGFLHLVNNLDYSGKPCGWRHEFFLLPAPPNAAAPKPISK